VTLDDVLEELVGDIPRAGEEPGEMLVRRDDGSWLADGQAPIADVEAALDAVFVEEERPGYQTLGGFVMARLEHVPHPGEHFDASGFRFEIVDMDGRRVDKVLIVRERKAADPAGDEVADA
jgi:putative hemolysin